MYISILSDYPCLEVVRVRVRTVRRYVVVVDVDAGVDLCDLLPGGWLSARLDSTRLDSSVRGTLGVDCVYSGVLCCAVLCASTTLLLLRSVVRVRARASHRRETCCACGRPCCVRCCHTVVWWWLVVDDVVGVAS